MARCAVLESFTGRLEAQAMTRILAFGSSNTERRLFGMHWLDVLELAIVRKYGRIHHCINTGVGGETSGDLLRRFETDAAFYQPHLAFITIGGNDSFRVMPAEEFKRNLLELHHRFRKIGTLVAFQTYYSPDPEQNGDLTHFYRLMDIVRECAAETNSMLIDQLRRWEMLRKAEKTRYKPLMADGFHLNWRGNAFMGLELTKAFGLEQVDLFEHELWAETRELQAIVDALDR